MLNKIDTQLEIWINKFVDEHPILFMVIFTLICSIKID